jgi:Na+-transporting NADH:ubiquinone oxidoreductase subunit NqrB
MTINQLANSAAPAAARAAVTGKRHRLLTVTGAVGIGYTLSWIAGLTVPAPSPKFSASGAQIVSAVAGHAPALALQYALTEGLPAVGIAVVAIALARLTGSRLVMAAGVTAAVISVLQFCLGMWLTATSSPVTAHVLFQMVNRMDGVKMLVLAVLGAAVAAAPSLPRWLRWTGAALAVAIAASGVVYLLLLQGLQLLAGPALVLLLFFITGAGIWLGATVRGR